MLTALTHESRNLLQRIQTNTELPAGELRYCAPTLELVMAIGELREMNRVAAWNVLTDAKYREHSRKFRDNATLVAEAAQEGDFRKAAPHWFEVTTSCMDCHDHVRKERKGAQ